MSDSCAARHWSPALQSRTSEASAGFRAVGERATIISLSTQHRPREHTRVSSIIRRVAATGTSERARAFSVRSANRLKSRRATIDVGVDGKGAAKSAEGDRRMRRRGVPRRLALRNVNGREYDGNETRCEERDPRCRAAINASPFAAYSAVENRHAAWARRENARVHDEIGSCI